MTQNITDAVFEQFSQRPKAALLMSGLGSNTRAILSDTKVRDLYDFVAIATDNSRSNTQSIGDKFKVPTLVMHADHFTNYDERETYFTKLQSELTRKGAQIAIYAGFMKISTPRFGAVLPGVNVHPADLSIRGSDGVPKYRGMQALTNMRKDLGYVRSTFHVVDNPVDSGPAISFSEVVHPNSKMSDDEVHDLLKAKEHSIYTRTLRLLGEGVLDQTVMPYEFEKIAELSDD